MRARASFVPRVVEMNRRARMPAVRPAQLAGRKLAPKPGRPGGAAVHPAFAVARRLRWLATALLLACITLLRADVFDFELPAQPADRALLAISKLAHVEVLFPYDDLRQVRSNAVIGRFDPQEALERLLRGTGFTARRMGASKWGIAPTGPPTGTIKGKLLTPDGLPARRVDVTAAPLGRAVSTNEDGEFELRGVPPGERAVIVSGGGNFRPLQITGVIVVANRVTTLEPHVLRRTDDPTRLDPFVVQAAGQARSLDRSEAPFALQRAAGNLDLGRTESDVLPYTIFNRAQITRSGVVNLNEFLQRELIDSSTGTLPAEQALDAASYRVGSNNLGLRGYAEEETVILVNGRRLPEVLIHDGLQFQPADVNFIPLSLVQQVEVLPVSASSLYSGSAVGGVINIVLRPDLDASGSEVTTTYTNAFDGYDAPQLSLSLVHAHALCHGKVRVRLNANFTRVTPPTEAELKYRQRRAREIPPPDSPVYRATPNVRGIRPDSASGEGDPPLPPPLGAGTPFVTSVAPGADGTGGIAAFRGREGIRNFDYFDSPGAFSTAPGSADFPYGREQQRATYYGSVVYDVFPWLQVGLDGTYSTTIVHRGYDVVSGDLTLRTASPFNPFGQDVMVSLNETAPLLGEHYSEARLEFGSAVFGAILRLPADWRLAFDAQYAHNLAKYRGLHGADLNRWQALVDRGEYNPLRDTQVFGPPPAFYDEVLVYRGSRGRFVTLGNYYTIDLALRATHEALRLPAGPGILNLGADFRQNHLAAYTDVRRFSDGTPLQDPQRWNARTLNRYSFFGELQAPLVPERRRPKWLRRLDGEFALRYVAAADSHESNFAPTCGLRLVMPGGMSFRGSVTASNRFPTPQMSRLLIAPSAGDGTATVNMQEILDPIRHEQYFVQVDEVINPDLRPEAAVTQTAGLVFERGQAHRFRAAIDFIDTRKTDEFVFLDHRTVVAGEALWPERVRRAPAGPGDPPRGGFIQAVTTSRANLSSRHSQDWTTSLDYRWNACLGGTLEAYARLLFFQRYDVTAQPGAPAVDELNAPDGVIRILEYRGNFGVAWTGRAMGMGADGHYFHSRSLPASEWQSQGSDRIGAFWQFDAFVHANLGRWIPWISSRYGLRAQARVNNALGTEYPRYANDTYGTGVQPYGDWRGRVYSLSVTVTF